MIERVALGQTRFATPGVAVDARGVVLGRHGALLFAALDGVVGWLRLYSDEGSLDDLVAELKILRVRTQLRSRAFILFIPAGSSYVLDKAARCARLVGGSTFTGSAKHFVKYRDDRAPYGYDVVELEAPPPGAELVLHGEDLSQAYAKDGELDLRALLFQLSLRRVPGSEHLDADARAELFLTCARGLSSGMIRYLWRNRIRAEVALVSPLKGSEFAGAGEGGYVLARIHDVPPRILENFRGIPGVSTFRGVADNVACEIGWAHPVSLSSCTSLFDRDKFYVFFGARDGVDVIAGPVEFVNAEHLTDVKLLVRTAPEASRERPAAPSAAAPVAIDLRLVPTLMPPRRIVGTLVSWDEAPRLKKLVYALPPAMLRGHQVAVLDRGVLLVARDGVDVVPLGTLLGELAPGMLIPVGMDLVPRVAPDVLAQALGHGGGPFQVGEDALAPLERRMLARLEVPASEPRDVASAPAPDRGPEVVNDPVGRFALWSFPAPPRAK